MRLAQRFRPYTVNKTKRVNLKKNAERVIANREVLKAASEAAKSSK